VLVSRLQSFVLSLRQRMGADAHDTGPVPLSDLTSPSSMKKYTSPRQSEPPERQRAYEHRPISLNQRTEQPVEALQI
jgi:hypothetical protein